MGIFQNIANGVPMLIRRMTGRKRELRSRLILYPKVKHSRDVEDWQLAVKKAEHIHQPHRYDLVTIINQVMDDAHLASVVNTRRQQVLKQDWIVQDQNGQEDDAATAMLRKRWFYDLTTHVFDSELYGHSLIEFAQPERREFEQVSLIPREYVIPQLHSILPDARVYSQQTPYDTGEYPYLLEAGGMYDLGLLNKAVPLVLYKRFTLAAWQEHTERYGQPVMIGRTNTKDQNMIERMDRMIEDISTGAGGVLDVGEELEYIESNRQVAHLLYQALVDKIDNQLSKLVGGQTMTADDGSSLSQAQVHLSIADDYTKADIRRILFWHNDVLLPFLIENGYPLRGRRISIREQDRTSLKERWDIVNQALKHYHVPAEWIEETFGIPVEEKEVPAPLQPALNSPETPPNNPDPEPAGDQPSNRRAKGFGGRIAMINSWYAGANAQPTNRLPQADVERLIEEVWDGTYRRGEVPVDIAADLSELLQDVVERGWGAALKALEAGPERDLLASLLQDVERFANYKVYHLVGDLADEAGRAVSREVYDQVAGGITGRHLGAWLAAEEQAVSLNTIAARQWQDFQLTAETLPNLRYETAGDDRVRDDHRALDGVIRPITDTFWDSHFPPIDFGCRCDAQATSTRDSVTPEAKLPKVNVHPAFDHNPGKDGRVFTDQHPYYQVDDATRKAIESTL